MSLIETIRDCLQIPFIEENNAVMDGSFTVEPYYADSFFGDGAPQNVSIYSSVDLFYVNRNDATSNGIKLFKALNEVQGCFCDNPDFTFEKEANLWRTTLRVQEVLNE